MNNNQDLYLTIMVLIAGVTACVCTFFVTSCEERCKQIDNTPRYQQIEKSK